MAEKNRRPLSPPLHISSTASPTLSAVRSSPLATGTLRTLPPSSSFTSSPEFSFTAASAASPDLFDDFTYSDEMDDDFRIIDSAAAAIYGDGDARSNHSGGEANNPPTRSRDGRAWVVFNGRNPGVYNYWNLAIVESQGFPGGYQRAFPDRASAEAAWIAFMRNGTYPEHGRSPWVVYLGRSPGVFERVTELECSIRGYTGAIYRSCSSVTEGNIRSYLFAEKVAQFFAGGDPFSNVQDLLPTPEEDDDQQDDEFGSQPSSPDLMMPDLPLASQGDDPSSATSVGEAPPSELPSNDTQEPSQSAVNHEGTGPSSSPTDGWYVAFHAVLPGVYFGVEALKEAKPKPGGIHCALDKESADLSFLELTLGGSVVWVRNEE